MYYTNKYGGTSSKFMYLLSLKVWQYSGHRYQSSGQIFSPCLRSDPLQLDISSAFNVIVSLVSSAITYELFVSGYLSRLSEYVSIHPAHTRGNVIPSALHGPTMCTFIPLLRLVASLVQCGF